MTAKMMIMMMMMTTMMMNVIKPTDARVNLTLGRAHMRHEWFNPKYRRFTLRPAERYYFEQVRDVRPLCTTFGTAVNIIGFHRQCCRPKAHAQESIGKSNIQPL